MQACDFYGNVLQWLVSYLKNRKQFVEPNGAKSQIYFVSHGVQQGSLLGLRLFSIYLNDFAESLSNRELHLYADDTTAFATGNSVDQVIQLLNVLPKEIIQWCRVNRLTIHWGKCKTMIITKQRFIGSLQQVKWGDVVLDFTEVAKWQEFCHIEPMTSKWCQKCSLVAGYWTVNQENLGTRFSCLGSENKMHGWTVGGTFYSFHGEILSINMARTAWRWTTFPMWSIFADLNRPLSPKLPDKDALSIWTYIDQRYHVLACF